MLDEVNPLLPTSYDVLWSMVAVAVFTLVVIALVSIGRRASRFSTAQTSSPSNVFVAFSLGVSSSAHLGCLNVKDETDDESAAGVRA